MRTGLLILSGYNMRAVIALCRWAAAAGVPMHLIASGADDPVHHTDYAAHVLLQRETASLDIAHALHWVQRARDVGGYDRVVFAPTTESLNRLLLAHRAELESAGGVLPLVPASVYARISDKDDFASCCRQHGLEVPATFDLVPEHEPFVAKPRRYGVSRSGRIKPYLIRTPAERDHFLAAESPDDYLLQEYVDGESLYLLLHLTRTGIVTATSQENLVQQSDGRSVILARAHTLHTTTLAAEYVRMLRALSFHGLIMIEVRRCPQQGRTVMIEANPRLWGPMQFTLDQGVDLFTPWLRDWGVEPHTAYPIGTAAYPYYFWAGGLSPASSPLMYHNYSAEAFAADHAAIAECDLFARADTMRLHHVERLAALRT